MKSILEFFRKRNFDVLQNFCWRIRDRIGEPPWEYDFLYNLPENEYPKYLAKIFNYRTGEKLPLKWDFKTRAWVIDKKRCKTFNQKIQWIKLYGVTDLMRKCTDKVAVRDYVRERIGEEYLKPVLQIIGNCSPSTVGRGRDEGITLAENDVSTYFDKINWEKLPNAFVIKCNHGCKWQYIIKNKDMFLKNKHLIDIVRKNMTGWLEQEYFLWNGFEMQYATSLRVKPQGSISGDSSINEPVYINQYESRKGCQEKGITPKILIESFFNNNDGTKLREIEVYCFNRKLKYGNKREITLLINQKEDDFINQIFDLCSQFLSNSKNSIQLEYVRTAKNSKTNEHYTIKKWIDKLDYKHNSFKFVRIDWIVYNNQIYFNEMTFTPFSGLVSLDCEWNNKLGTLIEL